MVSDTAPGFMVMFTRACCATAERNVVGYGLLEAWGLDRNAVDSRREIRSGEVSVGAGFGVAGYAGSDVRHVDLRVADYRA